MKIKITNPKNGLSKTINANNYKAFDILNTFKVYMSAGYKVHFIAGIEKFIK